MKKILALLFTFTAITFAHQASAQCDSVAGVCGKFIKAPFVSDGQAYRALVLPNQEAEFRTTFYAGTTYRLAACSGKGDGNLLFNVYSENIDNPNEQRNPIFLSAEHKDAPYWDFKVTTTVDVVITALLNPKTGAASGCAVLLVGFKQ
ncbi:MAG: hypothetical protein FD123_4317 [Bacteroidetes bacterium]|nr:MAG: hypothetical protein FD123_4317 [Bacteroidota bacterium]